MPMRGDSLADGVDDDAGLCPVTWISPHTTTTEHTSAATMITVTQRVFRVLAGGHHASMCGGPQIRRPQRAFQSRRAADAITAAD